MSESSVQSLEKALGPSLIWTGGLTSLDTPRGPDSKEGTISLQWVQSNFMFPVEQVRSHNVLDGTPESPQDHYSKTRGTLLSPQECKIAQCTPSQLEMEPMSLHWLHSYHVFHIIQNKLLDFLQETTEIP